MAVKIQLFGQLKQIVGSSEIFLDVKDTDELKQVMNKRFPTLHELHYLIAVDKTIVQNNTIIHDDKELALLPPYSGG